MNFDKKRIFSGKYLQLEEAGSSDMMHLANRSNCDIPGIYLFRISQWAGSYLALPITDPEPDPPQPVGSKDLPDLSHLPEPFLLPFGPNSGDTFTKKVDSGCSSLQPISRSLVFGSNSYSWLYVCTNGYISFENEIDAMTYWFSSRTFIAAFLDDLDIRDNLLDYACFSSEYVDYREPICAYLETADFDPERVVNQDLEDTGIEDPELLLYVEMWFNEQFPLKDLNVNRDDYLTWLLMGKNTTKYVNLGNNIMKREITNQSDFDRINTLIATQDLVFKATFGYVVTYYKASRDYTPLAEFNSFQIILACDDFDTFGNFEDNCFAIFDYFEIQSKDSYADAGFNAGCEYICRVTFNI